MDFVVGISQFKKGRFANAFACFEKSLHDYGDNEQSLLFASTILYLGLGVERDSQKAHDYYRRASVFDSCIAQYTLGLMCRYNDGVQRNYKIAIECYILAAKLGYSGQHIQDIYHLVEPPTELDDTIFWYTAMKNASSDDDESTYIFDQYMDLLFRMIRNFEKAKYISGTKNPITISITPRPKANRSFIDRLRILWYKIKRTKRLLSC